jgi:hypothetical protein
MPWTKFTRQFVDLLGRELQRSGQCFIFFINKETNNYLKVKFVDRNEFYSQIFSNRLLQSGKVTELLTSRSRKVQLLYLI